MKDPAVLFYTSDFIAGTITMTDEQRGQYILLLCLQHQKGFLYEKDMLKICGSHDDDIWCKFTKEGDKFYNSRMKNETEKRRKYSESRSQNRKGKTKDINNISKSYDNHMGNENINENIDKSKEVSGAKKFTPPTLKEMEEYFAENGFGSEHARKVHEYYTAGGWKDSSGKPVKSWKQKCIAVWFKDEHRTKVTPRRELSQEERDMLNL